MKYDIDKSSCDDKYKANFSGSGSRIRTKDQEQGPGTRLRIKDLDYFSGEYLYFTGYCFDGIKFQSNRE